jgi:hypothetical protein
VWELTGVDDDHDASDHGYGSATASCCPKNDDYNNAHGRRLLIAKADRRLRLS